MKFAKEVLTLLILLYLISAFIAYSLNPAVWPMILRILDMVLLVTLPGLNWYFNQKDHV